MKLKKVLCLTLAVLMLAGTGAATVSAADTEYPIGYWNIAYANRYLTFATDGGSFIKALELPLGTVVDVNDYIPTKDGYIFDGWYSDPRTKQNRVGEIVLTENITVYAKWLDDGTPKQTEDKRIYATNAEIMQYGSYVDEKTGVPVTALWVQQNARLQALMQEYNARFNN